MQSHGPMQGNCTASLTTRHPVRGTSELANAMGTNALFLLFPPEDTKGKTLRSSCTDQRIISEVYSRGHEMLRGKRVTASN